MTMRMRERRACGHGRRAGAGGRERQEGQERKEGSRFVNARLLFSGMRVRAPSSLFPSPRSFKSNKRARAASALPAATVGNSVTDRTLLLPVFNPSWV